MIRTFGSGRERVLLLNPPGDRLYLRDQYCSSVSKADYYWPPIDLLYLSGMLGEHYEVGAMDAIVESIPADRALAQIEDFDPHAVIFLTGVASWTRDLPFVQEIKQRTGARTIGTGGVLLYEGTPILSQRDYLDAILLDFSTPDILTYLQNGGDGNTPIPNVTYKSNGKVILGERATRGKVFEIPVPRHEIFPLSRYRMPYGRREPVTSVMQSDGCPWTCSYCVASPLKYRYRPLENMMAEFEHLRSIGVKEMLFKDFTFGVRKELTIEMCQAMIRQNLDLSWVCESRIDVVDRELLTAMRDAGCHTIQFGVESADVELLERYRKKMDVDETRQVFALCRELGIRTLGHFILGLPGETRESIMRTVDYAKELRCDYASFNTVIPQVGTDLRTELISQGWYDPDEETFDSGRTYPVVETANLSKDVLWDYRNKAIRSFYTDPSYLWRRLRGTRSLVELRNLVKNGYALLLAQEVS
ncbi:MAG: radical SAM protein [Chloroflexota bacterium]|nr:radical SAM protein [Chloroflexota bacterium]